MLISSLPEDLRKLAEQRRIAQGGCSNILDGAFTWRETPEGFYFWNHVDRTGTAPQESTPNE